jgi:sugar phosphate isomerase/epimerase
MAHLIACRIYSYGKFVDKAWTHLPSIGIRHVEINIPEPDEVATLKVKLADHGLTASTLAGRFDVQQPSCVDDFKWQLGACNALGTQFCFLSVKADALDRDIAYQRLGALGEAAAQADVTIVMETHPDLITNGDIARQTMRGVNHPNVRVNFDTANVYYYNHNVDAVGELAKVIDDTAAIHLKDTNGGYKTNHFPALGQGVVDFPTVFELLNHHGFNGPCTMELEGMAGVEFDEAGRLQYVADSVQYLRDIGVCD